EACEAYAEFFPDLDRNFAVVIDISATTRLPAGILSTLPSVGTLVSQAPRRAAVLYLVGPSGIVQTFADIFTKTFGGRFQTTETVDEALQAAREALANLADKEQ
ncbi:MAG: hypothetical protein GYB64_12175, partial [Chloroflexi bacterium]|nr:hypothetical protein [Chloroflexota bacterium]